MQKILCDRCKREFEIEDVKLAGYAFNIVDKSELICPDCQNDADIELF